MKKISMVLMAVIAIVLSETTTFAAEDWEKIYSDVIYNESLSVTYSDPDDDPYSLEYGLFDIDGDNVPELFVGSWQYKDVYTIKNNRAEKIWKTHTNVVLRMLPNENAILDGGGSIFDAYGLVWSAKFHMTDGKITPSKEEIVKSDVYHMDDIMALKPEMIEDSIDYGDGRGNNVFRVKNKIVSEKQYGNAHENFYQAG